MFSPFTARFLERYPLQAAEALELAETDVVPSVLGGLGAENAAPIVRAMLPHRAAEALPGLDPNLAAAILEQLDFGHAVRLLLQLDGAARSAVLAPMKTFARQNFNRALSFPQDTIGRFMQTRIDAFRLRDGVRRVMADLPRNPRPLPVCFIVDDGGRPQGAIKVAELIGRDDATTMAELLLPVRRPISALARLEAVREAVLADGLDYLPVVDPDQRLIGVLAKIDWTRAVEQGHAGEETPELVSLWLGVASLFWQVGARMISRGETGRQAGGPGA